MKHRGRRKLDATEKRRMTEEEDKYINKEEIFRRIQKKQITETITWEEDRCTEEGERLAEKRGRQINKQEKGR